MKKILFIILSVFFLVPSTSQAIVNFHPLSQYGYVDAALWQTDTADANDNDAFGDVSWFYKEPQFGQILPREIYIGSNSKFSSVIFSVGNSPLNGLRNNPRAVLKFSYPRITDNRQIEYIPLEVKDMDGGFTRSNQIYRYNFTPPADWLFMSAHVRADNAYHVKVECIRNCANEVPGNVFEINEVNVLNVVFFNNIRLHQCDIFPFRLDCQNRI